jgi:hypothetical protein
VEFDWSAIGMALVCSAVALAALHAFGQWLAGARQFVWSLRSSAASLLAIGWLFILSVVAGGLGRTAYALTFGGEGSVRPLTAARYDLLQRR